MFTFCLTGFTLIYLFFYFIYVYVCTILFFYYYFCSSIKFTFMGSHLILLYVFIYFIIFMCCGRSLMLFTESVSIILGEFNRSIPYKKHFSKIIVLLLDCWT